MASERWGFWSETVQLVRAVARAMGVTFRNLMRRPITVRYPTVKRVYPDRFRGILALTYDRETGEENCIGCRLCEYICPPQVIKVEMLKAEKRNYAKTFTLELYSCEFCELCVQVCPTDAIIMLKSFDLATADRRELLLDKDRLHALGLEFEPSWATGNRLRDMQAPPKAPKAAAHAAAGAATTAASPPDRRAPEAASGNESLPDRRAAEPGTATAQDPPDRRAPEASEGAPTRNQT
jgi:NADH-quinone oxidoreductase subunit I